MDLKTLLKPAIGALLIYAADKFKGMPAIARVPVTVVGTIMLAKGIPVVSDEL